MNLISDILLRFEEVDQVLITLQTKKACDPDGIGPLVLQACASSLTPILKAVADGPVGQVLAGPLFLKVKTKFHFTKSK